MTTKTTKPAAKPKATKATAKRKRKRLGIEKYYWKPGTYEELVHDPFSLELGAKPSYIP